MERRAPARRERGLSRPFILAELELRTPVHGKPPFAFAHASGSGTPRPRRTAAVVADPAAARWNPQARCGWRFAHSRGPVPGETRSPDPELVDAFCDRRETQPLTAEQFGKDLVRGDRHFAESNLFTS